MNDKLKQEIINNEYKLIDAFPEYKNSITQLIHKIEIINHDYILYEVITRSFGSGEKKIQEMKYNSKGYLSSRQIITNKIDELDMDDKLKLSEIKVGSYFNHQEICSLANNYNNQVGMYYLKESNAVIIKSTVEDNNRPYDDKWLYKNYVLKYFMKTEKESNVNKLVFSNTPNAKIFDALMEGYIIDVYTFINTKKGDDYRYMGVYHPCGLIDRNKAFILYKDGHENEVPYDNLDGQFLMALLRNNMYPDYSSTSPLSKIKRLNLKKYDFKNLKTSKRTMLQQQKIDLEVSLKAEDLVVRYERAKLTSRGLTKYAQNVENSSLNDIDIGYDILSYEVDSTGAVKPIYIKVISSVGDYNKKFKLSYKEYNNLVNNKNYRLYRVFDIYTDNPKFYDLTLNEKMAISKTISTYECELRD